MKGTASVKVRFLWWVNFIGVWLLAVPMVLTPLKQFMPSEHFYGIVSSIAVIASFTVSQLMKFEAEHPYPDDDGQNEGA